MSEVLWCGEHRVDRASQKMLRALRGGEWVYGRELRDAADLGENTQVFYRMERYLEPSGLVIEAARIDEKPRQFQLMEDGEGWVEEHADEILAPATREEVGELRDNQMSNATTLDILGDRARDNRDRSQENSSRTESLQESVEVQATIETWRE